MGNCELYGAHIVQVGVKSIYEIRMNFIVLLPLLKMVTGRFCSLDRQNMICIIFISRC